MPNTFVTLSTLHVSQLDLDMFVQNESGLSKGRIYGFGTLGGVEQVSIQWDDAAAPERLILSQCAHILVSVPE